MSYQKKQHWRIRARKWVTKYAGDECTICGYNNYIGNLVFHHIDPKTKTSEVTTLIKNTQGWTKILDEVKKCILICNRCHGEVHAGIIKCPKINFQSRDEIYKVILEEQPIPHSHKFRYCKQCGKRIKGINKYCSNECCHKSQEIICWPSDLSELVKQASKRTVAQKLGVSDKAVAKRLKNHC